MKYLLKVSKWGEPVSVTTFFAQPTTSDLLLHTGNHWDIVNSLLTSRAPCVTSGGFKYELERIPSR